MIDLTTLREANDIEGALVRLVGGKPLINRTVRHPDIELQLGPGYEIVGLDNATPERLSTQVTRFVRGDLRQPIFVLVRDSFDGEHLLWWHE